MACFLVPAAEAVAVTIVTHALKKQESHIEAADVQIGHSEAGAGVALTVADKLKWLTNMLWGGAILLAFEHVWHGEVVPWFPFLTAAGNPADAAVMLHEMSTVGVTMALLVTAVWVAMVLVTNAMQKKPQPAPSAAN